MRLALDYIETVSLRMDIVILLNTIPRFCGGKGIRL